MTTLNSVASLPDHDRNAPEPEKIELTIKASKNQLHSNILGKDSFKREFTDVEKAAKEFAELDKQGFDIEIKAGIEMRLKLRDAVIKAQNNYKEEVKESKKKARQETFERALDIGGAAVEGTAHLVGGAFETTANITTNFLFQCAFMFVLGIGMLTGGLYLISTLATSSTTSQVQNVK